MSDIYKAYKELEEENYKLEQRIYYLEEEIRSLDFGLNAFKRVENKMKEQFEKEGK